MEGRQGAAVAQCWQRRPHIGASVYESGALIAPSQDVRWSSGA